MFSIVLRLNFLLLDENIGEILLRPQYLLEAGLARRLHAASEYVFLYFKKKLKIPLRIIVYNIISLLFIMSQ